MRWRVGLILGVSVVVGCGEELLPPTVRIEPREPSTLDDLLASIDSPGEPDRFRRLEWWVDGELSAQDSDGSLPASLTVRGQEWAARLVEYGLGEPDEVLAEDAVTIVNSPPAIPSARIVPESPRVEDALTVQIVGPTDPDRDAVEVAYSWFVDGELFSSEMHIEASALVAGQEVYARLTPRDGEIEGPIYETSPVLIDPEIPGVGRLAVGPENSCYVDASGAPWCWGFNHGGRLAVEDESDPVLAPSRVRGDLHLAQIHIGHSRACGLTTEGALWCWGQAYQLEDEMPWIDAPEGATWVELELGARQGCVIDEEGGLICAGFTDPNGIMPPDLPEFFAAQFPVRSDQRWRTVRIGPIHACGIRLDGLVDCWGRSRRGQLGDPDLGNGVHDSVVMRAPPGWRDVAVGETASCGIRADRSLWCWGDNLNGQLGAARNVEERGPVEVAGRHRWLAVSLGPRRACAIREDQSLWCWGDNRSGQLGDGTYQSVDSPVRVGPDLRWIALDIGEVHGCAEAEDHSVWCWGDNALGQLGDSTLERRFTPVRVAFD